MYDINQIVNMTGINRNKLYKLIKENEELKKFIVRDSKKIYVLDDGLDLLINNKKNTIIDLENHSIDNDENEQINYDILNLKNPFNEDILKILLNQLNEKDKQIDELLALNKNNQILLKEEKEVNKIILDEHFKEVDIKLLDLRDKMNNKRKSKKDNKKNLWFFIKNKLYKK